MTSKNTEQSDEHVYAHSYLAELQDLMLAAQIQVLREERSLSQQELGDLTGMAQSRISLLESADYTGRTLATLRKLAAAFDVGLRVSFVPYYTEIRRLESRVAETLRVPSRANEFRVTFTPAQGVEFRNAAETLKTPTETANLSIQGALRVEPTSASGG